MIGAFIYLHLQAILLGAGLSGGGTVSDRIGVMMLPEPNGDFRTELVQQVDPIDPQKVSPTAIGSPPQLRTFSYLTEVGTPLSTTPGNISNRFRIFSESQQTNQTVSGPVGRELARLWEFCFDNLKIDHNQSVNHRMVDVYLTSVGTPGGEQMFCQDQENGSTFKANVIYIYDLKSFDEPIEEAREVAHEYGHAVLPAIGGYSEPEYWANGYLGESLFLRWFAQSVERKALTADDAIGASAIELKKWVAENDDPIEATAAELGPKNPLLSGKSKAAMRDGIGLILYADSILPKRLFARSLQLLNSETASAYLDSCCLAAEEETFKLNFPTRLIGKSVWAPVGSGKLSGGKVLARARGWVKTIANSHEVVIASGQ